MEGGDYDFINNIRGGKTESQVFMQDTIIEKRKLNKEDYMFKSQRGKDLFKLPG